MMEMQSLGRINLSFIDKSLQTDIVIVTNERIMHIKERHPEDYELFKIYGADSVQNPDYIIEDCKHTGTVFMVKQLPKTNLNVVRRLALSTDEKGLKNSIMTFYRIREKNLRKLIEKNQLLYKKE
ncbi:MAG: PBECR2 nuclease fold domain-containing protein [Lachnospiraceae bacterium]|nr:PBECR2 nuclease fold domain-containing protein [Lachnospiraceae bacterium]